MNKTPASKPLASIPREVYLSALQTRPGKLGDALRAVRDAAGFALALAVFFAPLPALLSWAVSSFVANPGTLRLATTAFLAAMFALCLAFHCLELFMAVPWKDRSYPVLLPHSLVYGLLVRSGHGYSLSVTTGAYAALLWLAWWRNWQLSSGERNILMYAAVNTVLGAAMFLYGRFQPYGAFSAPTREDRQWLESGSPTALANAQLSASAASAETKPPTQADYMTPVSARPARLSFSDIFGMEDVKDRLVQPARAIVAARVSGVEPPVNGILLHGAPGNGKTIFAEALAGELQVPIITLTYGDVASKWIGEMPRLISNCFAYARAHAPCVFFIDEIDSFLRSRALGSNNAEDLKIVNTVLTEIVEIREHRVVLVGATNFLGSLDTAAIREGRFDIKLEIPAPDEPARIAILTASLKRYAPGLHVDHDALLCVASRWQGFSASRLVAVCRALEERARKDGASIVEFEQWQRALRQVQGAKARAPAGTKRLRDLVLEPQTRQSLQLVADRLCNPHRIESLGGSLPTGVLLHGEPGTGKTAAAGALARESGWAFIAISGPDLMADRERVNRVYSEAMDLRPAIIFIDEADQVLANRQFAPAPEIVNRMLALMDGASSKVRDVVFIAATNHPEQVDPALLRAGRFTEKIELNLPPGSELPEFINSWLGARRVRLEPGLDADELVLMVGARTIADLQGILQYAVNCAIERTDGGTMPVSVVRADVCAALKVLCGVELEVVAVNVCRSV